MKFFSRNALKWPVQAIPGAAACPGAADAWPILVISLADATERRRQIAQQLDGLGLGFTFIEAIDGRRGLPAPYSPFIDRPGTLAQLGRAMTDGEYACALSHLSVYRRIVDQNLPGAIVLEDDAILRPDFAAFLGARVYEAVDLIQLDHRDARIWRMGWRMRVSPMVRMARLARNASLTTGYSVSRRAAAHILGHALPLRAPADWPCDVTGLGASAMLHRLVDHPAVEDSVLEAQRAPLVAGLPRANRALRFFNRAYWRLWCFKRLTRKIS